MLSPTKKRRVASDEPSASATAAPPLPAVAAASASINGGGGDGGGYQFSGGSIPHSRMSISPSRSVQREHSPTSNQYRDPNAPNFGRSGNAGEGAPPPNDDTMDDDDDDFDLSQAPEMAPVTAAMASLDIGGSSSQPEMQEKAIRLAESGANFF